MDYPRALDSCPEDRRLGVRDCIGGNSSKIRKRDPTFDLKAMLLEGRRDEQSTYQAKQIESKESIVGETNKIEQKPSTSVTCRNCGRNYPHTGACPAKGKICNNRGKPNHFAAVCRGKHNQTRASRNQTYKSSNSDDDYLYTMTNQKNNNKVNVTEGGAKFKITIDTSATINVIDRDTFMT